MVEIANETTKMAVLEDKQAPPGESNKSQKLLRVDQIYSRKDRQTHFVKTAKTKPKPDRAGKNALVVRRIIDSKGAVAEIEIDIRSEVLAHLMQDFFRDVEGMSLNRQPPMAHPKDFFFARHYLADSKKNEVMKEEPSPATVDDIETALRFVEEDFGSRLVDLKLLLEQDEITFDLLWIIFPPQELVFAHSYGQLGEKQAMYLTEATYIVKPNGAQVLSLHGRIITYDGEDFGWGMLDYEIAAFAGAKKITSLTAYPFKFHPSAEQAREELVERGKKFVSLVREPVCKEYAKPLAIQIVYMPDGRQHIRKVAVQGRLMADPQAFKYYADMETLNEPYVYARGVIDGYDDLTNEQLVACASWVNGFCFSSKVWARFMVSQIAETTWNEEAFAKLQIADSRRQIIHGLVKAHRNDESSFEDFVPNKGRGMVGLLSGSPGVGKTLTAEVVSEVTHRPLYQASGGELGMDPDTVDKRLAMILEVTRRWSAVLLIDEADVFLSARGKSIAQDTLVSIFLRRIEYFQGVLILTTNRREEIDPAFESRIHFRIHYPDLDKAMRIQIWKAFIHQHTDDLHISESDILELSHRPLNGRQIKNATSCAVSLARNDSKQYTLHEVKELLDVIFPS